MSWVKEKELLVGDQVCRGDASQERLKVHCIWLRHIGLMRYGKLTIEERDDEKLWYRCDPGVVIGLRETPEQDTA